MRAARRLWARTMKEKWEVTDPNDMVLRFHVNVSGHNYTYQQSLLNITRGAIGALAAVLGGTMGLQVPSYDEAWAYQCCLLRDTDVDSLMLQRSQTDPRPNWVVRAARSEAERRDADLVRDMVRSAYAKKAARKAAMQGGAK